MSFTSRMRILFWNELLRTSLRYKTRYKMIDRNKINKAIPSTIGFSLFTWLGFDKKPTPEDELIQTIKYSILFIRRNEYDKAERLLHVALRQAQQIQHHLGITYIYDVMANLALQREQLDKAKSLFIAVAQRLVSDGATEDDIRIVHISVKLARISHLKKEYDVAELGYTWCMDKLREAMKSGSSSDTMQLFAIAEDWYGRLHLDRKETEKGFNLMVSALNHMREVENVDKEHIIVQLNDLGTVCESLNRLDESIEYFQEAISNAKEIKEMEDLGAMYVNLGKVYIRKNMLVEARKNCGYGWKLGNDYKREEIKNEANACLKQINDLR